MKVMVVDDNEQSLYLLEVLLKSEKYEVVCARDGLKALEHLEKGSFGLIISDILMPRMDGFQLCRECKGDPHLKHIPFIFYTATYTDQKDEELSLSLGADRFVIKPQEPEALMQIIRDVLAGTRAEAKDTPEDDSRGEGKLLKEYSEALFRKLEKKMADLEQANLALTRTIIERKQIEEALRESEKKYRTLVTQSPDAIFVVDLQGTFLAVNKAMCERLKYSEGEFLSMKIWDIVPEKYVDLHKKRLADILRGEAPNEAAEYVVRGKDEKMHYVEVLSAPYFRENEVIGFQGIARDITERKRAEEALRKSEERYRSILEEIEEGYFETNLAGNLTFINDAGCAHLGYSREELIGMNNRMYTDKENAEKVFEAFNKLYRTGQPCRIFDYEIIKKDGTKVIIEMSASLMRDSEGKLIGFRGISQDITERKRAEEQFRKSEEKYRQLFDEAPVGYHEYDTEGRVTQVNQTELDLLGYPAEEMIDRYVWEFIVEKESREQVKTKLDGTLPTGQTLERTYRRKDGTLLPVSIQDRLLRDPQGRVIGIRSTIQDITERKRAEKEMLSLQEQLRQSQKMEAIGQLAGGIAHDFNNLLTVIKGNSELSLLDIEERDPLRENIEEIKEAADKAAGLTRQLLAFSRKQILEMKVLDLNQVMQRLDKMLRRVLGEDIELKTSLSDFIGKVKVDPGQIEQVMINLAVNARDAMPDGGKLTIETANVELDEEYAHKHIAVKPGRYVMLSMSDNGVGMTPEVRERIFEPFFSTKEKERGTGLGLSTVYGIVKQSGGSIWVYSEPGQGTTFKIYLPQVDEPWEEMKDEVIGEVLQGNETILIVEDEEVVLKLAVRVLKKRGYKVLEAPDGGKAFMLCEAFKEPIHLILTDVVMPGMSGSKLVERLKKIHPEMKVLYMSGYTDNAILHHGVLEPGVNFIQKPFNVDGLSRKVREVLDK